MRSLLAVALLLAAALSGCAEDPERYPDGTSSSTSATASDTTTTSATSTSSATSSSATSTTNSPDPANQPPVAALSVAVNGTQATFTLDGSDPDGDDLTWTLTFGDGNATNGTALPTVVNHTYAVAGNFSAAFTVSDGALSAASNQTVAIVGAGGGDFAPIHQEGSVTGLCVQCSEQPVACLGMALSVNEFDCFFFEVPPEAAGRTATATSDNGFVNVAALSACAPTGTVLFHFLDLDGSSPYSFEVPEGTGCLLFYEWADLPPALVVDIV